MFNKIYKITITTSFLFLVNQSIHPVKADGCGIIDSQTRDQGANKAKQMAIQRLGIEELEEKDELKSK